MGVVKHRSKHQGYRLERERLQLRRALRYLAMMRRLGRTDRRLPTRDEFRRHPRLLAIKIAVDPGGEWDGVEFLTERW